MSRKSTKSLKAKALGKPDRPKRVNSKVKGNRGELMAAEWLKGWTGKEWRRVPQSGAYHVPLDWLNGDLFCLDKYFDFEFSVEVKSYKKVTPGLLDNFWGQAQADADRIGKHPMLMVRQNGYPEGKWDIYLNVGAEWLKPRLYDRMEYITPTRFWVPSESLISINYEEFSKYLSL